MRDILSLNDLKERLQAGFEKNEESLELWGKTYTTQLKAHLIEVNNLTPNTAGCPFGEWQSFDTKGWYGIKSSESPNTMFLDATRERVWILYSLLDALESEAFVKRWISGRKNLDNCWLSRKQLLRWENLKSWNRRGIGISFSDGLSPEEDAGNLSLKVWHGAKNYIPKIEEIIESAKEDFAIYSVRWQKRVNGTVAISAEWYSSGRVTINRAIDVDEVFAMVDEMANRYTDSLKSATDLRNSNMGAFEIDFSLNIDLQAFSNTVSIGKGEMKLWLIEIESESDFKRFKGVDLHTWDRVFLDIGTNYAYLTIPEQGCVNAAPRIATIQGEDNAGKTSIYYDGVEIFA